LSRMLPDSGLCDAEQECGLSETPRPRFWFLPVSDHWFGDNCVRSHPNRFLSDRIVRRPEQFCEKQRGISPEVLRDLLP
jgi:hypothetical protein